MTPLEEFRQKIEAGEIFAALAIAMSEAVELDVTTSIASAQNRQEESSQSDCWMHTRINLIDGKIENEISRKFANNSAYAHLQKLHLEQVKQGREIVLNNLASLQSMFAMLNETQSKIKEISATSEPKSLPEN